jgi:hypothetical protein
MTESQHGGRILPPDPAAGVRPIDLSLLSFNSETTERIEAGRDAFLFGAYLEPMIEVGVRNVENGSMQKDDVATALLTTADLFCASGVAYKSQPNHLADQALEKHQRNVLNGDITLVSSEFEMSEENRLAQLRRADETFAKLPPHIQAIIAELNYEAFFRPQTMASGERTRDRDERDKLIASLGQEQDAMPHLTLTNWSIGDISKGILEFTRQTGTGIRIVDTGSGPGGTLSAITSRLSEAEGEGPDNLAITGIETTQGFYNQLEAFLKQDETVKVLGLTVESAGTDENAAPAQNGKLTIIKADTLSGLKRVHDQGIREDEVVVITGNYSWHRLDSARKKEIMQMFKDAPNVVFLIGDFASHGNPVAKQYFCLGANGPLNVGNIGLNEAFTQAGYSTVDLSTQKPGSLDERFREKIVKDDKDPNSDGHLWIAYKGNLAEESLRLQPVS